MRLFRQLTLLSGVLALIGCGDDETGTGGGGTTSSTTGATTSSTTTSSTTTSSSTGTGGMDLKADGESCADGSECEGNVCLSEDQLGWAQGYCSTLCSASFMIDCGPGSICVSAGDASLCLKDCGQASCTGPGQECIPLGDQAMSMVCIGGCTEDNQCMVACDNDSKLCGMAETCDNGSDDDGDALQDCEELDCAADGTCMSAIASACSGAIDVSAGGTFSGTTAGGSNDFAAICPGFFGSYPAGSGMSERVFSFTAPANGVLSVQSAATAGDFDLYVRDDCSNPTSLLGCFVAGNGFDSNVTTGQTVTMFVDGYISDADYELTVSFAEVVCGDGIVAGAEECDDGNTMANDGCSPTCVVEQAFFCANAIPVTANVPIVGDTSLGTDGFSGSCGGSAREQIYLYTPAQNGSISISVTPTAGSALDAVLYVRNNCADTQTQQLCADLGFDGDPETGMMSVLAGMPITIFVDTYSAFYEDGYTLLVTQN